MRVGGATAPPNSYEKKATYTRRDHKEAARGGDVFGGGQSVEEVCKKLEVSPPTYHRWKEQYGGAKEETVKRLKELEKENGRLKRIVGDMALDNAMPEGAGGGKVVSPERKREAVLHLQDGFCASERRACRVTKQPRATQRYRGVRRDKDAPLIAALHRVSESRPRAGYRVAAAHLRREGWQLNDKRAQRLWRQEGLKVPRRQRKRRRLGSSFEQRAAAASHAG